MQSIECSSCKSRDFEEQDGRLACVYCRTVFISRKNTKGSRSSENSSSSIEINEDIIRLLEKAKAEPWKAKNYAELILEINPNHEQAQKMLKG